MILSSPGFCMTADPLCKMLNCQGGHGMAWHGMAAGDQASQLDQ